VVTADARAETRAALLALGADAVMAKPLDPGDLAAMCARLTGGSHTAALAEASLLAG
jgi:DNA-binding response OmpR family regulator